METLDSLLSKRNGYPDALRNAQELVTTMPAKSSSLGIETIYSFLSTVFWIVGSALLIAAFLRENHTVSLHPAIEEKTSKS